MHKIGGEVSGEKQGNSSSQFEGPRLTAQALDYIGSIKTQNFYQDYMKSGPRKHHRASVTKLAAKHKTLQEKVFLSL